MFSAEYELFANVSRRCPFIFVNLHTLGAKTFRGLVQRCAVRLPSCSAQILYLHLPPHVRISPMFSTKCDFTTFASRTLYFHPLTDSFRKNRGVGYARPNNQMTSLFIPLQKGKKPRIAWGEAIRGLGDNDEDWAVRSSLRPSVARPL